MSTVTPPPPPPEGRRRPFQFSMATLMVAITLIAVGLGLLAVLPYWIGVLALSFAQVAFVAFLVAGAFFADGRKRTFCIGALSVFLFNLFQAPLYVGASFPFSRILQGMLHILVQLASALFGGWICVVARRFWENRSS